jgi:hypothetical protein
MMMKLLQLLFLFTISTCLHAQKLVKGIVVDAEKNIPVPKASVFLNNTSIGTTASEDGKFELRIPEGRYELIISSVGYQTHNQSIVANETPDFITIKLQVKTPELETIFIEPYEKNGWQNWGAWFIDNFLGLSEYGRDCKIKNHDVLKFRNSKRENALTVIATAPLVIENKALGYKITYQLENFRYDFKTRYLFYAGYPFFENMEGSDRKKRKWEMAREDVFKGSVLQFMRALYRNKIKEEGFEVRRLQKIPNAEKQRIKMVYKTSRTVDDKGISISTVKRDSVPYYDHIMSQEDFETVIGKDILPGDSIAYAVDSTTAGIFFEDYLLIIYKHKSVPPEFKQRFPKSGSEIMSEITLINAKPLQVFANGAFFNPEDLLSSGYWGWWEKMGTMLPFDYEPHAPK